MFMRNMLLENVIHLQTVYSFSVYLKITGYNVTVTGWHDKWCLFFLFDVHKASCEGTEI